MKAQEPGMDLMAQIRTNGQIFKESLSHVARLLIEEIF